MSVVRTNLCRRIKRRKRGPRIESRGGNGRPSGVEPCRSPSTQYRMMQWETCSSHSSVFPGGAHDRPLHRSPAVRRERDPGTRPIERAAYRRFGAGREEIEQEAEATVERVQVEVLESEPERHRVRGLNDGSVQAFTHRQAARSRAAGWRNPVPGRS